MDQEDARCNGAQNARKVLLSCCSNVYRIAINFFTDNCWVYLMAELGPDCPVTIPLNSQLWTTAANSNGQQHQGTGVKVTGDVRCEECGHTRDDSQVSSGPQRGNI